MTMRRRFFHYSWDKPIDCSQGTQFLAFAQNPNNARTLSSDRDLQGTEKSESRREKAIKAAEERFDFSELSKCVLGKTWHDFDIDEQERFVALFTKLLEICLSRKDKKIFKTECGV